MKLRTFCILMLLPLIFLLGCDGSKKAKNAVDGAIFETFEDIKLCKKGNYTKANLPEMNIKACFRGKFEDSRAFSDIKIMSKDQTTFYLVAKGMRDGNSAQFAVELAEENGELILQDYDRLYYTCIARYCEECAFKFNDKGAIGGCNCGKEDPKKPTGFAACEHTIGIKTSDKE